MSFVEKQEDHWKIFSKSESATSTSIFSGATSVFKPAPAFASAFQSKGEEVAVDSEAEDEEDEDGSSQGSPGKEIEDEGDVESGAAGGESTGHLFPLNGQKVETGEENEDVELTLRTKLYRLGTAESGGSLWIEMGTGPLKVLTATGEGMEPTSRLVMRRESQAGGHGTKLLVNISLSGPAVNVFMLGENAVRVTCVEWIGPEPQASKPTDETQQPDDSKETTGRWEPRSYLFKFKLSQVRGGYIAAVSR